MRTPDPFDDRGSDVLLAEFDPVSPWCQRWGSRRHSYVHRSAGGFDPERYRVEPISEAAAKDYVVTHHYSGTYPAASRRFGLFHDDPVAGPLLVGAAVFGIPASRAVLANVVDVEPYVESLELSRLVLEGAPASSGGPQRAPANSESWFVARCFEELTAGGLRAVVSFADPVPRRTADGTIVAPGHVGIVYQALNALHTGRGTARRLCLLPDGTTLNDRAAAKVRAQHRGHDYVEKRLVAFGARAPKAGEDMGRWLTEALDTIGARRVRHGGNHRYVWRLGPTRQARRRVKVLVAASPAYPKHPDVSPMA